MHKKISLIIITSCLLLTTFLHSKELCNKQHFCIPLDEYTGEPRVYLIANPRTDESLNFEKNVKIEAIRKKIVMGAETLSRDEQEEKSLATALSEENNSGYIYGLENPIANLLTDITNPIRFINAYVEGSQDQTYLAESKNALSQLLLNIKLKPLHAHLWEKFKAHVEEHEKSLENLRAYRLIDSSHYVAIENYLDISDFARRCIDISNQVDIHQIRTLFVKLALFICDEYIAKLPIADQPNLQKYAKNAETNTEILKKALNNLNSHISSIITRFDLGVFWRNSYSKNHFHFLYNQAQLFKKDLVIIVSIDNYPDILAFLEKQNIKLITHKIQNEYDIDAINNYLDHLLSKDGDIFAQ